MGEDRNSSVCSQASVNKDWENWAVLHGNNEVAVEDVWAIAKAIGVKFNGDKANMFNVLSRGRNRSGKGGWGEGGQEGL